MGTLQIVFTILGLVGTFTGPAGIILWLLGRKGANKKLDLDERGTNLSEFEALKVAYREQADEAKQSAKDAQTAAEKAQKAAEQAQATATTAARDLNVTNQKLESLRKLFQSIVKRSNIILSPEEQEIFDNTAPIIRKARRVSSSPQTS